MSSLDPPPPDVFYLGPPNSYTHQAALRAFPRATLHECATIPSVFTAVSKHASGCTATTKNHAAAPAIHGVIPVENSTNGPVAATLSALTTPLSSDLLITSEIRVPVRHCLVAHPRNTRRHDSPPNFSAGDRPSLKHITALHTHNQAWGQCTRFLKHYGLAPPPEKGPRSHEVRCADAGSTSAAAVIAAADSSGKTAALSSLLAAQSLGLEILLEGCQDSEGNVTRFLVLSPAAAGNGANADADEDADLELAIKTKATTLTETETTPKRRKALVTFELTPSDPARPGALSDALAVFKTHGLSLTSLNTRPRGGSVPWEYCFLVEVDVGGLEAATAKGESGTGCARLDDALVDLKGVVGGCMWKGTWSVDADA